MVMDHDAKSNPAWAGSMVGTSLGRAITKVPPGTGDPSGEVETEAEDVGVVPPPPEVHAAPTRAATVATASTNLNLDIASLLLTGHRSRQRPTAAMGTRHRPWS